MVFALQIFMESEVFTRTIQSVEILFCPGTSVDQKNVANGFLQDLQACESCYQVAITILQSKNSCKKLLVFCYYTGVTINSKIYAMNLLCTYVKNYWKSKPDEVQQEIIRFAECYLLEGVSVFLFIVLLLDSRLISQITLQL